jgi:catechol 2,3-dioxygenase-like lactoylglutathione lyase family enzyme
MPNATPSITGFNHLAVITADLDRFTEFWTSVFGLEVFWHETMPAFRHTLLRVSAESFVHAFEFPGNPNGHGRPEVGGRGHLDHFGLTVTDAATFERLRSRLVDLGCSDGSVSTLGPVHSCFFTDPDGMECEIMLVLDPESRDLHAPQPFEPAVTPIGARP